MDIRLSGTSSAAILMYHRVAALNPDVHQLCIAPESFREHMNEVSRGYHAMALLDLVNALASGNVPPRAVAVTFDDGCIDNLGIASEILQAFDVPATFFIPTERLDEKREYWWDALERIFISAIRLPPQLDLHEDEAVVYRTETGDERAAAHRALGERIRTASREERDALMNRITAWAGVDLAPRETHRPMVSDEIRELSRRRGHAIGAHSIHHLSLPAQPADVQRNEVFGSKVHLEQLLGMPVTAFAYPYGHCDDATVKLVAEGFAVAVTATAGPLSAHENPLALPRIDASPLTREELGRSLDAMLNSAAPRPQA